MPRNLDDERRETELIQQQLDRLAERQEKITTSLDQMLEKLQALKKQTNLSSHPESSDEQMRKVESNGSITIERDNANEQWQSG